MEAGRAEVAICGFSWIGAVGLDVAFTSCGRQLHYREELLPDGRDHVIIADPKNLVRRPPTLTIAARHRAVELRAAGLVGREARHPGLACPGSRRGFRYET